MRKLRLFCLVAGAFPLAAQTFEVASIRPHVFTGGPGGGRLGVGISGSHITASIMTLNGLIAYAYNVKTYQISGGPVWAGSGVDSSFDITAKSEGEAAPSVDQVRLMIQALLADRFQLKLHRDTKDLPVFDLVVAKGGVKLKESAPDAKAGSSMRTGSQNGVRTIELTSPKLSIVQLGNAIGTDAGRPVVDKTGLAGTYEVKLAWTASNLAANGDIAEQGASIFTALQELGLRLEPAKAATEVLVVEHAEKPSDN